MGRIYYSFWSKKKNDSFSDKLEDESSFSLYDELSSYWDYSYTSYQPYQPHSSSFITYDSEIVEKFRKVYKHIDDFKSILNVPEKVKILFKEGFTIQKNKYIHVKTEMFDNIADYNEALNVCLGGALIEFAKYHHGTEEINPKLDVLSFDNYKDFVLSNWPGYSYLIELFEKYKSKKSHIFEKRHDTAYVQAQFDSIMNDSDIPTDPDCRSEYILDVVSDSEELKDLLGGKTNSIDSETVEKMIEGSISKKDDVYTYHEENEEDVYRGDLEKINPYISMVANSLGQFFVDTKIRHYGSRNGILDSNKLVEAIQGAPNVYYNEFERKTTQLDVCVVIDESGSMRGGRIILARQAAILLNEACKQLTNCDLYIYGHSADTIEDCTTDIHCYKDTINNNPYALGKVAAKSENRDGEALRDIAKKVRTQTKNKVLMFVLSDGNPSAEEYRWDKGIDDTRNAVKEIEKQDFIVTQCTFRGTYVDSAKMFTNFIEIDNMDESEFATKFTKFVSGTLLKNYQITES